MKQVAGNESDCYSSNSVGAFQVISVLLASDWCSSAVEYFVVFVNVDPCRTTTHLLGGSRPLYSSFKIFPDRYLCLNEGYLFSLGGSGHRAQHVWYLYCHCIPLGPRARRHSVGSEKKGRMLPFTHPQLWHIHVYKKCTSFGPLQVHV